MKKPHINSEAFLLVESLLSGIYEVRSDAIGSL
jgi:hypothetical protein